MASLFPLLFLGGGALLLITGKKKRKSTKKKNGNGKANGTAELPPEDPLPEVDEDLDEKDQEEATEPKLFDPKPKLPEPPVEQPEPAEPEPSPEPGPSSKPVFGPSGAGNCANSVYTRDPQYFTPDVTVANQALTLFPEAGYYFYIRGDFQTKLYNYMLERFSAMKNEQERRTVASVILREGLKHFNSDCKWESPVDSLSKPEQLVWDGGARLAQMAQVTVGLEDPSFKQLFQTGKRYSITRESLDEPDPGFIGAQKKPVPGTRVEILVTDTTQEHAEHIIGEIAKMTGPNGEPDLFEIRIIDKFQGANVAPRLRTKHGFKTGSNAYFSQKGPTGIYRIFPQGMV